jgi:hypothetical protein
VDAERLRHGQDDQAGVTDRRQGDEEDTIFKSVDLIGCHLQREPGLATPARAGQREQARLGQKLRDLRQLRLPSDEIRELGGQVVRPGLEAPQGREVCGEIRDDDLEDLLGALEVFQAVLAEIAQADAVRQVRLHQVARGLGQQHLPAVPGGA